MTGRPKSAQEIAAYAERQIHGGDVILLHDGEYHRIGVDRSRSVEATDRILSRYKPEGYDFVTIPQMMAAPARPEGTTQLSPGRSPGKA